MLLVSDSSNWSERAFRFLGGLFPRVDWYAWDYGTPHTRSFEDWDGCDLLFSFKADFIIPDGMLAMVRRYAVNFHPSTPDYRGIGGYRYALDDRREEFGATCHFITSRVDAGPIINVSRFPIHLGESEEGLRERAAAVALEQLRGVATAVAEGRELVADRRERWGDKLFTRSALAKYREERLTDVFRS